MNSGILHFPLRHAMLILMIIPALSLQTVMARDFFRWTDEQGVTHFGEVPPTGVPAQRVSPSVSRPDPTTRERLEAQIQGMDERAQSRREASQQQHLQAEAARIRSENCSQARRNMETLTQQGGRILIVEQGEHRALTEEERQERIQETQAQISEFCD
ncbi:hypothetical protein CKO35_15195 [Ectothiorhodospira shaposhnikovii]|uniref:DUF4124 domain-containing protein n=1 Tax=Ectothiorhodospira shaposhnikovii TaxID=1054 RepID=UPI0019032EE6|nr:DUF4124 domain-containing protein [Ectothiorhodospira shaposhnikovii]MBK1674611.1 hypothetical protein [Ectothiorhodospira shaposhnikovii]